MSNKKYINEPELTPTAWAGKHANKFNDIRKEIEENYLRIGNSEIEGMLNNIETQIAHYEGANQSLSSTISSKRDQISQLSN